MNDVFWLKNLHLGRLHFCLGRNDAIYSHIALGRRHHSVHINRLNGHFFTTFRIGSRFLNIDWV